MTEEEDLQLLEALKTNPDFLAAFDFFWNQMNQQGEVNVFQAALFLFSRGYKACLDYEKTKEMTRPFKYDPSCH